MKQINLGTIGSGSRMAVVSFANTAAAETAMITSTAQLKAAVNGLTAGGIISGGGDPRFVLIVDLFVIWGFAIPMSFLCAFKWNASPVIVLLMLNSDQYMKCVISAIRCNSYKWVRNLTR